MSKTVYSLGMEFSTQSVKLVLLDLHKKEVVLTSKFDYDTTFPLYKTNGGVLQCSDSKIRHTSPYLLIEALDYAFQSLLHQKINLSEIYAIKVDAMQHCTVYTNSSFKQKLGLLNHNKQLLEQLKSTISRQTSPIWEDRSTIKEVEILTDILKKEGGINNLTGNRAELRFPASQIMKWAKESPKEYNETENIFLLSAFITSLLSGKISPVDTGDGWGTNLNDLNIKEPKWNKKVIKILNLYLKKLGLKTSLEEKIGKIVHYDTKIGKISSYFVKKYGVNKDAIILAGTGDNPATLLGCGGNIVISLGSSYTVNGVMEKIVPSINGEYNIFGYTKNKAMSLMCITNGGKVHEYFLRKYIVNDREITKTDWSEYIKKTGNYLLDKKEYLMLPYLMDESVPLHKKGFVREGFDENNAEINIRSLHISQVLGLKLHSCHLSNVDNICIVGGGSKNKFLRQLITDVFNVKTYSIKNSDYAAALGCAISGAKYLLNITYKEAANRFVQKDLSTFLKPIKENVIIAKTLLSRYSKLEKQS